MLTLLSTGRLLPVNGDWMRVVLWCNGDAPSTKVIERVGIEGSPLFGVDGGADKARDAGYEVHEVIGDVDSVDTEYWDGSIREISDSDSSDLSKALSFVIERGVEEIDVLGIEGGSFGHQLGAIGSMAESPGGSMVRFHHESGVTHRFHPSMDCMEVIIEDGGIFSVFALTSCNRVSISGSKWEIKDEALEFSTRGLSNQGKGGVVRISADGVLAVFLED